MPHSLSNAPLFSGSNNSAKDLGRFLLSFKARHLKVGDGILGNIVAMMATFLPSDNMLRKWLSDNTSTYLLLKTLDNMAAYDSQLRCLKIDRCVSKCMGFYATNANLNFCLICAGGSYVRVLAMETMMIGSVVTCRHLAAVCTIMSCKLEEPF
jgi:hypothetical protein